jgi:Ca2+-transporting ATPase
LLDRESVRFIALSGGLKAAVALTLLAVLPLTGVSLEATRTATFLFMAVGQLLFAYPARRTEISPQPNRLLHLAVTIGVLAQIPIMTVPGLEYAFQVTEGPAGIGMVSLRPPWQRGGWPSWSGGWSGTDPSVAHRRGQSKTAEEHPWTKAGIGS